MRTAAYLEQILPIPDGVFEVPLFGDLNIIGNVLGAL
jgi:hypothetical protein